MLLRVENLETRWECSPSPTKVREGPPPSASPQNNWKSNGELAGAIFVGEKLIGDTYVPAGEESTRVNTTDGTVNTFLCFKLYRHHQSWNIQVQKTSFYHIGKDGTRLGLNGVWLLEIGRCSWIAKDRQTMSLFFCTLPKHELIFVIRRKWNGHFLDTEIQSNPTFKIFLPSL